MRDWAEMKAARLQTAIAIAEIVIGLLLVAMGLSFLILNLQCPAESSDCAAWGILGAAMFLIPGVFIAVAGALYYRTKRFPFGVLQTALIGALIVYYLVGFAFP